MKTLKYILSASISLVFLTACNDSFLEKYPETELNEEAFFQTPEDMAIYLNNSYKDLPYGSDDLYSDNIGVIQQATKYTVCCMEPSTKIP